MIPPRRIKVFIASPGDLGAERIAFRDTIDILNAGFGDGAGVEFIPMGWEDTLATTGRRPQAVINADIDSCEVFILAVYRRWGQEAPDAVPYASYTEEEFHRAFDRSSRTGSPTIFVFFKHVDPAERAHPDEQLEKSLIFRRQLEETRRVLYRSFDDAAAFKREIDTHLRAFVKCESPTPNGSTDRLVLPIEYLQCVEKAKAEAEASLRRAIAEQDRAGTAEAQKALVALRLSERAAQAALEGRLEDARQDFAIAIDGSAYGATLLLAFQFYFRTGDLIAAESVVARILSAPGLEPNCTAAALISMGAICLDRGQYVRAIELYTKSRALCEEVGNLAGVAGSLSDLGIVYTRRGELDKAETLQRDGLELAARIGDPHLLLDQYTNLGATYRAKGELDKAEETYRKGLTIAEGLMDEQASANLYSNLGVLSQLREQSDVAERMLLKALSIFKKLGHAKHAAIQYHALAVIYKDRHEFERSEQAHRKALALNEAGGFAEGIARGFGGLGMLFLELGDPGRAAEYCLRALAMVEKLGDIRGIAAETGNMAMIRLLQGDLENSVVLQQKAVAMFESVGDRDGLARNQGNLGYIYQRQGDLDKAAAAHVYALRIFDAVGSRGGAAKQREHLGSIYRAKGEFGCAEEMYREAIGAWQELRNAERVADSLLGLAVVYEQKGDVGSAVDTIMAIGGDHLLDQRLAALGRLADADRNAEDRARACETCRKLIGLAESRRTPWNAATAELVAWSHLLLAGALQQQASTESGPRAGWCDEIGAHFAKAIELQSALDRKAGILCAWASALQDEAEAVDGGEADGLLAEACGKYRQATGLNPQDWYAFAAWGNALADRARRGEQGDATSRLLTEAVDKFEAALRINSGTPALILDFAELLLAVAGTSSNEKAGGFYARACEMFEASDQLERLDVRGLHSWAMTLLERIEAGPSETREKFIIKACEKLEAAWKAEPGNAETLHSWGYALMLQAEGSSDDDVEPLLTQAADKFEAALKVEPGMRAALQCLGVTRMRQATSVGDAAGRTFLEEAKEKLLASEAGYAAEGTAEASQAAAWARVLRSCVCVRLGEDDAACELLNAERAGGSLPPRDELLVDADLVCLWSRPRLREIIEE